MTGRIPSLLPLAPGPISVGYENVAADRQGVTDTLVNSRERERLRVRGIQLLRYRELAKGR